MKPKRRNLTRWMESRLRRLDAKIKSEHRWWAGAFIPLTPDELNRCRDRAHRLACDIQIAWGKQNAAKLRASA